MNSHISNLAAATGESPVQTAIRLGENAVHRQRQCRVLREALAELSKGSPNTARAILEPIMFDDDEFGNVALLAANWIDNGCCVDAALTITKALL